MYAHPEAQKHADEAKARKEKAAEIEKVHEAVVDLHGLKFVHIRRSAWVNDNGDEYIKDLPTGGLTVAYTTKHPGGKVLELSTAPCSPSDTFCKKTGRIRAAANFHAGNKISLRRPNNNGTAHFLKSVFEPTSRV